MIKDSAIIELFFMRSEKAITELSNKYGKVLMKVSMNVLKSPQEAEECVNDSYLGVWNAIPPEKPEHLLAFVCRIVRNISINCYKKNNAQRRKSNYGLCLDELEDFVSSDSVEDACFESEVAAYIDEFLDSLSETDRMIFVRRYWFMDSYEDIASASGLKEGAVRTRISRIKSDLKSYLEKREVLT